MHLVCFIQPYSSVNVSVSLCHLTDNADACLWVLPDICCAISALCNEHNVVHEDLKRCDENTGKMAMMDDAKRIPELSTGFGLSGITA